MSTTSSVLFSCSIPLLISFYWGVEEVGIDIKVAQWRTESAKAKLRSQRRRCRARPGQRRGGRSTWPADPPWRRCRGSGGRREGSHWLKDR